MQAVHRPYRHYYLQPVALFEFLRSRPQYRAFTNSYSHSILTLRISVFSVTSSLNFLFSKRSWFRVLFVFFFVSLSCTFLSFWSVWPSHPHSYAFLNLSFFISCHFILFFPVKYVKLVFLSYLFLTKLLLCLQDVKQLLFMLHKLFCIHNFLSVCILKIKVYLGYCLLIRKDLFLKSKQDSIKAQL